MYPTVDAHAAGARSVSVTWSAVSGAASYEIVRSADAATFASVGTTSATSFIDEGVQANTSYLYKVRALSGGTTGPFSAADLATTVIFTDDPLIAGTTTVKAAHVDELRVAVNAVRALAARPVAAFTDPTLTPAVTAIRATHLSELRTALAEARSALALAPQSYTDSTLAAVPVKAIHLSELRAGVR
jgi:fibronectin type 3 domain-containing protein